MNEATFYYAGLPSAPVLVARTSTAPWRAPINPEAYIRRKELRPVGNHAIVEVWEDNLAFKIHALLNSMNVMWTSTDVVRIGYTDELALSSAPPPPVILWIGVMPKSLSADDEEGDIVNVDVEIRDSVVTRSAGPKLLSYTHPFDPTDDIREPLTTALGIPISTQSTPHCEGTGGFFITEGPGRNAKRLLLVTVRHVVFTPDKNKNEHFEYKNDNHQHRHNITLFGDEGFTNYLESIQAEIFVQRCMVERHEERIKMVEGKNDPAANREREDAQFMLTKTKRTVEELNVFYQDVSSQWATQESRVLGHVILSPPINVNVGTEGFTEDWAVIEVDASKVDSSNFEGNFIDLGKDILSHQFIRMMSSHPRNSHSSMFPKSRILKLKGTIPDEELRHPTTTFDQNDSDPCLIVLKRGSATGLTIGRANNIMSYVRYYSAHDNGSTSKEWPILPLDSKSGPFSNKGDSGSVIVDGRGRVGGLLTSGTTGNTSDLDITYATPINFLLRRIQEKGLYKPNINPVLAV
ncbi:hypothetical protein K435DRAFT_844458 [Dendrothele bispora CBS 962.96]|uniref:Uncharacterized protein n=1 Tax=Dendrothele bispora (strain CBS 962.96) TaxID=1314807 RepID=A0A4S8L1V6_DENBC|nr:hypothetical protein K435DRAFT_844458 [Dendrothele bispora CBS 962.96]